MRGGVRGVATTTTAALLSSQRENPVVLRTLNVVHEICPAGVMIYTDRKHYLFLSCLL